MPVTMPPQQPSNLGSALALWNQFMQPSAAPASPIGPGTPPGTSYDPATQTANAPSVNTPGSALAAGIIPKSTSWNGSDPWFNPAQSSKGGSIVMPADNSGNLGKAVGSAAGGGLSGLLSSI